MTMCAEISDFASAEFTVKAKLPSKCRWKRVQAWSPESPCLYDAKIKFVYGDREEIYIAKTGFKELKAIGNEFYLNGEPYYILGDTVSPT